MARPLKSAASSPTFAVGTRIQYRRAYLKSIGAELSDEWWTMDGTVVAQVAWKVVVLWDDWDKHVSVLARNLQEVDPTPMDEGEAWAGGIADNH